MTPDQQEYYNNLEEMFGTKGWKIIVEEASSTLEELSRSALFATQWEQVKFLQGQVDQLSYLINLEEIVATQKEHADAPV